MEYNNLCEAMMQIDEADVSTIVISHPSSSTNTYRKIRAERNKESFFVTYYTKTQAFHKTKNADNILTFCEESASGAFKQINIWLSNSIEIILLISKKNKVNMKIRKCENQFMPQKERGPNSRKAYIISEGMIIPPLIDMGIVNTQGEIVKSKYDKFKQINRFIELIDDEFKDYHATRPLRIVDFGCGKSYLTFILYYYFTEIKKIPVDILGLDLKREAIEKCNNAAKKYGYTSLHFEVGDIADYVPTQNVDVVITLHACDTATDYALYNAIKWNADKIFSVPCCQHEINNMIMANKLKLLTRYGIIKERFSALLTDALRANILEYCGYKTQLLEFIDFEHTPKNVMIRAVKRRNTAISNMGRAGQYLSEIEETMREFNVKPTLYSLLIEGKTRDK